MSGNVTTIPFILDATAYATFVLALITAIGALFAWRQLKQSKDISSARLLVELHTTFHTDSRFTETTDKIQKGSLNVSRPNDTQRVDDYLGFFECIKHCIDQGVLDKKRAHRLFGYYILKACYYEPIKDYISQTSDYWIDLRKLSDQMIELEKTRLRLYKNEEVISRYASKVNANGTLEF